MINDDDAWLEALAGRIEPAQIPEDQHRALVLEAFALREWIRRQASPPISEVRSVDVMREQDLLARATREGLIALPGAARRSRIGVRRFALAAAAVLVVAIGIGFWQSIKIPQQTVRGIDHGTVYLVARDPLELKRQLTTELQAAGAKVSGYTRLGRVGIDADLPQPLPEPIAQVLKRHHIPIPADGILVVEIEAPSSQ